MTVALLPEVLLPAADAVQTPRPLATEGVQRYLWESRFGAILIEVVGDRSFVNGCLVEPAESMLLR